MKVVVTGLAQDDIREITLYIENELHNTLAANKFLEKLLKRLQLLSQFPELAVGTTDPNLGKSVKCCG